VSADKYLCGFDLSANNNFRRPTVGSYNKRGSSHSVNTKQVYIPILIYGLDLAACRLNESDISSLDFVVHRFFMKMFKMKDIEIVRTYQERFRFRLPNDLVASRSKQLESGEFVR